MRPQLALSLNGYELGLALQDVEWSLANGAAGLQQLKLRARYVALLTRIGGQAVFANTLTNPDLRKRAGAR